MKFKNKTKQNMVLFKLKSLGWEKKKLEVDFDFSAKESCSFPNLIQANLADIYECVQERLLCHVLLSGGDTLLLAHKKLI